MTRTHLVLAAFGLALGFTLSSAGFSDWTEIHRMFTFGLAEGGPRAESLRLLLAFAGAVALLFGAGWALCGACPAAVLVQLGDPDREKWIPQDPDREKCERTPTERSGFWTLRSNCGRLGPKLRRPTPRGGSVLTPARPMPSRGP